jgi:hypothetical protein
MPPHEGRKEKEGASFENIKKNSAAILGKQGYGPTGSSLLETSYCLIRFETSALDYFRFDTIKGI